MWLHLLAILLVAVTFFPPQVQFRHIIARLLN
jgi:hypothetical protein